MASLRDGYSQKQMDQPVNTGQLLDAVESCFRKVMELVEDSKTAVLDETRQVLGDELGIRVGKLTGREMESMNRVVEERLTTVERHMTQFRDESKETIDTRFKALEAELRSNYETLLQEAEKRHRGEVEQLVQSHKAALEQIERLLKLPRSKVVEKTILYDQNSGRPASIREESQLTLDDKDSQVDPVQAPGSLFDA